MNKGAKNASGKYLIFMNSGDQFANNEVLEKVKLSIEQNNYPHFIYGDSIDLDGNGNQYYRYAKHFSKNWIGMITQHQAMFFNTDVLGENKYSSQYPLAGDYEYISRFLKQVDKKNITYLEFAICKFNMGGTNEIHRYKALKEDYNIRKRIIKVPFYKNITLYGLHFMHTILKKTKPSSRFLHHRLM